MTCPLKKRRIQPSACLTCEYCGGLINGGVLCFKVKRKIPYSLIQKKINESLAKES